MDGMETADQSTDHLYLFLEKKNLRYVSADGVCVRNDRGDRGNVGNAAGDHHNVIRLLTVK
jgi:hypothetical protein